MKKINNLNIGKIATFDIEANNWIEFLILGFYDGKRYLTFKSVDEFLNFVLKPYYKNYKIYAHFGGRYDFYFLLDRLINDKKYKNKFYIDLTFQNSRVLQMKIIDKNSYNGKTFDYIYYFIDSYSLLPVSLKKLSKQFNVKHQKLEMDFSKRLEINSELLKYLRYDVIGLYEIILSFAKLLSQFKTTLKYTIASQSIDIFYKNFLSKKIFNNNSFEILERQTYYGGRTEIIKSYFNKEYFNKYLNYYDVNSLYPSIMRDFLIPYGNPEKIFNPKIKDIINNDGISYVKVENNLFIPLLPYRYNNKLIFPNGTFYGYYNHNELKKALEIGYKIKPIKTWIYNKSDYIFKDYIDYFYNLKKKSKSGTPMYLLSKLMMNSLYGKFAQDREIEQILINPVNRIGLNPYLDELDIWSKNGFSKSKYIIPIIASYITSYARIRLYNYIEKVGFENIYYMDTDSIFTTKKINTSNKLGKMKLEARIKKAIFLLPKSYALIFDDEKEQTKLKGFDRNHFKDIFGNPINYNLLENAIKKEIEIKQEFEKVLGVKNAVKRYSEVLVLDKFRKSIKSQYDKRLKIDVINTIPLYLKNDKFIKNPNNFNDYLSYI